MLSLIVGIAWLSCGVVSAQNPCPTIGLSSVCSTIITITDDGPGGFNVTSKIPEGAQPYDGSDDSLIGVINDSSEMIYSLYLTGNNIFGFEADGMCSASYASGVTGTNSCSGATLDPNGYGGNEVNFVADSNDAGGVNFVNGIASEGMQHFSLEEDVTNPDNAIVMASASESEYSAAPEPGTMGMFGGALGFLGLAPRRSRKSN